VASLNFTYAAARPAAPTFTTQKWAWTGESPGAWAELLMDTREDPLAAAPTPPDHSMTGILGYLKSYESMGSAKVCTCVQAIESWMHAWHMLHVRAMPSWVPMLCLAYCLS
jgi:hypothetical protein